MDELVQLSALICDIYDAALDPSLWIKVLESTAAFVGGSAASVHSKDASRRSIEIFHQYGVEPHYQQLYMEKYVKFDPSTVTQFFANVGDIISTESYMNYEEFVETRFYKEWARPQHWIDGAAAVLQKSATDVAMFNVFFHERDGALDHAKRQRMLLLMPHFRRAVLIGRLLDNTKSEAAELADTFDGLSAGMFLVDGAGRIIHANPAGHALLATGALVAVGNRLGAKDPESDRSLQDVFLAASQGDGAINVRGISIPLTARDGADYVAHVLPLTSGARRRAGTAYAAAAAVFAYPAKLSSTSPLEVIARRFKLTPTELRVLLAIVEVGGVPEVADVLGVSVTTVRSHLASVFGKTGVSRQADLVKLVAAFSNPLFE